MGYADTLPYQQLTVKTSTIPGVDITTVWTDFNLNTFHIPNFKRPISYATMDLHYTAIYNSSAAANWIVGSGSFGLKDVGGTYHSAESWINYNAYCNAGGSYYHGDACLPGTNDLSAHITPNSTLMRAALDSTGSDSDAIRLRNVYGVLNMYFNI